MDHLSLPSPFGSLTLLADSGAITGLVLPGQQPPLLSSELSDSELPVFREAARWLDRYWAGINPSPPPPLNPSGTPFQLAVWNLLRQIPYGHASTYGALSLEMQRRGIASSPQAVGQAVGRNPILLMLPCHRILGRGQTLSGYAAGTVIKRYLLTLEGIDFYS